MRVTGMPVQALTTSAISSGPTSWRSKPAAGVVRLALAGRFQLAPARASCARCRVRTASGNRASSIGMPGRLFFLDRVPSWLNSQLDLVELAANLAARRPGRCFSASHCLRRLASRLRRSRLHLRFDFLAAAAWRALRSLRQVAGRPVPTAPAAAALRRSSVGTLSSSIASRLAASSIRSIALSGRNRSVM